MDEVLRVQVLETSILIPGMDDSMRNFITDDKPTQVPVGLLVPSRPCASPLKKKSSVTLVKDGRADFIQGGSCSGVLE